MKYGLMLCLALAGCASVPQDYVAADRATKNAVGPMLSITAQDHPDLKQPIDDLMVSWELRLKAAEGK
jgi:hypothetical protein